MHLELVMFRVPDTFGDALLAMSFLKYLSIWPDNKDDNVSKYVDQLKGMSSRFCVCAVWVPRCKHSPEFDIFWTFVH